MGETTSIESLQSSTRPITPPESSEPYISDFYDSPVSSIFSNNASPGNASKEPLQFSTREITQSESSEPYIPDFYNCPLCLGQYICPKYLPCLHTVCHDCLCSYIKSWAARDKFSCPVCQVIIYPKQPDQPKEQWVDDIPVNHQLVSIMDYYLN